MSGGPNPFSNAFKNPTLGSLRYNTSQYGTPVAVAYGTVRISVNLIEYWGFKGGKKGSPLSKAKKSGGTYSVNVGMAYCQGPVAVTGSSQAGPGGYNRVWSNGGIAFSNNVAVNFFTGADGQAPDPNWGGTGDPNTPVIGYSGTAYDAGDPLQLGQTPTLPNWSREITGFLAGTITTNGNQKDDASPDLIVKDLLTNTRYGAGFPIAALDTSGSLVDYGKFCQAAGIGLSMLLDRQQPAAAWVKEITDLTVAAPFWSGTLLKIVPYYTSGIVNYGINWQPSLTPAATVGDHDFIDWGGGSDPVIVTRPDPAEATNWIGVEYYDKFNNFNPNVVPAFDQGAIDQYGLRDEPSVVAHSITNAATAAAAASLMLWRRGVRDTFKFQLSWAMARLEPMDIVALNDPGAGLNAYPVRITGIQENDNGELTFDAEELPGVTGTVGAPSMVAVTPQAPSVQTPVFLALPGNANAPIVFEPNSALTNNQLQVWLLSSGGPNWGGAVIQVSIAGSAYTPVGTIAAGAAQGVLTASLPSYGGSNPDATDTLSVDLTQSVGTLASVSSSQASNSISLCFVDGELIAYQTATLTSTNKYNLTTLYRGLYSTAAGAHSNATLFGFISQAGSPGLLKYPFAKNLIGQTISIKLQSFNLYGQELQDISTLTAYTYVLTGNGVAAVSFPISGSVSGTPTTNQVILNYTFSNKVVFPSGLTGSQGRANTGATAAATFSIIKNSGAIGTAVFAAGGSAGAETASFTFATSVTFNPGDTLIVQAPATPDATLANVTFTLLGTSQ